MSGRLRVARLVVLSLLLLGTALGGLPSRPAAGQAAALPPGPGDIYLSLGDSIALGVGASTPARRGFAGQVQSWLERLPGRVIVPRNLAVAGETSQSFLDGGQWARAHDLLLAARADGRRVSPLTLSLGGNDLLRAEDQSPAGRQRALDRFARNFPLIVDRLSEDLTVDGQRQGALVLLTVYNPRGGAADVVGSDAWWIEQFNGVIRETARVRGLTLVDVWAVMAGHEAAWTHIGVGDVHPTNAGHAAIAEAIWRALRYDRTAPAVELVAPAAGELPRPVPTVRARVSDAVGVARVELWADGQFVKPLLWLPDYDAYAATWDGRAAPAGPRLLEVRAFDAAGNMGAATVTVWHRGQTPGG